MIPNKNKIIDYFIEMAKQGADLKKITVQLSGYVIHEDMEDLLKKGFIVETDPAYNMSMNNGHNLSTTKIKRVKLTEIGIELVALKIL